MTGLHYIYDQNGRITTVSAKVGSLLKPIREYEYNSLGEISDITDHENFTGTGTNTVETTYSYDNLGRVTAMEEKDQAENTVESFTYTYDQNSNITSEVDGTGTGSITKEYTYDDLSRLTEVSTENGENTDTVAYGYDKAGNRVTKTTEDAKTTYHYNSLNQLTSSEEKTKDGNGDYSQLAASTSYTYDAKGNQLTETETKGSTTTVLESTYTVDSMLSGTEITVGGQTTLTQENTYNGAGQRVSKTENGTDTNYFYQDGSVLYTTGSSGAKTTQNFLTTSGSTMATARYTTSDISYYTYNKDIRNSTVSIVDETGAVATKYSYDEFGQTTVDGSYTFTNEICYTGGVYDWTSGQYYLNARYYDPGTGRFLSEDTYRGDVNAPDTLHLYAYCANNPINYVDPSGHNPLALIAIPIVEGAAAGITIAEAIDAVFNEAIVTTLTSVVKNYIKKVEKTEAAKKYYYAVKLDDDKFTIEFIRKISKRKALSRVKAGKGVYTYYRTAAESLANSAGGKWEKEKLSYKKALLNKVQYKHFHANNRNGAHLWYGRPYILRQQIPRPH